MLIDKTTALCTTCNKCLPRSAFKPSFLRHHRYKCRECSSVTNNKRREALRVRRRKSIESNDGQLFECTRCSIKLPAAEIAVGPDTYLCRPCGALATRKWRDNNPYDAKIVPVKSRAKRKGLPFDLDGEWYKTQWTTQAGFCFYSGLPMTFSDANHDPFLASIDKQVPELGYIKPNCVLCCSFVNSFKSSLPANQFELAIDALYQHQHRVERTSSIHSGITSNFTAITVNAAKA
jgi:hypothetical protein